MRVASLPTQKAKLLYYIVVKIRKSTCQIKREVGGCRGGEGGELLSSPRLLRNAGGASGHRAGGIVVFFC